MRLVGAYSITHMTRTRRGNWRALSHSLRHWYSFRKQVCRKRKLAQLLDWLFETYALRRLVIRRRVVSRWRRPRGDTGDNTIGLE